MLTLEIVLMENKQIFGLIPFKNVATNKWLFEIGCFDIVDDYTNNDYVRLVLHHIRQRDSDSYEKETITMIPTHDVEINNDWYQSVEFMFLACSSEKLDECSFIKEVRNIVIKNLEYELMFYPWEDGFSRSTFLSCLMSNIPRIDCYIRKHFLQDSKEMNKSHTIDMYSELIEPLFISLEKLSYPNRIS